MLSPVITPPGLVSGQRLSVDEFLRRWEELPELKKAELIDGVVYLSSPLSLEHARRDRRIVTWLGYYADATPGCDCAINSTWLMLESAPQPDSFMRILPSHGGQSQDQGLCAGAPELAAEVCGSSIEIDLGPKLALYQGAGVLEYITVEIPERLIVWRILEGGRYVAQPQLADGILRSRIFPGLWLDVAAFWANDGAKMLATLQAGLATEDYQKFAERLAAAKG